MLKKNALFVMISLAIIVAMVLPSINMAPAPVVAQDDGCMYGEAPMWAEMVAAGELPSVCERLPENPRVVEPIDSVGVYGGIWHRAWRGINDFHAYGRTNYDPVLRWPRDPSEPVQPSLAENWEFNEDGTELTLYFRRGLKWSDGAPWTVDDVIFWWEAIENDPEITTSVHAEWQTMEELVKIDDYTITLIFSAPNGLAETVGLAFHGNQWPLGFERFGFYAPRHYLEQYHPAYSDEGSYELFEEKSFDYNVDRPVMTAWKITEYEAGTTLMVATRNPYYYAVDIEGNQLPYIDQQYYHLVEGTEGVNAMGIAGDLSMQARAIDLAKYPLYFDNQDDGDYRMLLWPQAQASGATLWFNQSFPDEQYRELFQTFEFRLAMSHAIDRESINEIAFLGQGVPRTITVVPSSPYYQEDIENVHSEYDPAMATELLEGIGLVMGDDGFYTFADGNEILLTIETSITATGMQDTLELIASWWNEIGIRTTVETMTRDVYWPRAGANEVMVATWTTDRGLVPMVDPIYQFPFDTRSWMGPAFGLWYSTGGAEGMEPPEELRQAMDLYDEYKVTTDPERQVEIGKEIVRLSTTRTSGHSVLLVWFRTPWSFKNNFMNVADTHTADWIIMTPGTLDPAHFYFADGGE